MYQLPQPSFDSELVETLFEIERLRTAVGAGTTPPETFAELHLLFDLVMSVVSARIEGNHTTVFEMLDGASSQPRGSFADQMREIENIRSVARYIDSLDPNEPLTHAFVREIHARTVEGLFREGDPNPGHYRDQEVQITGSRHVPPSWVTVHSEMTTLLEFSNADFPLSRQMLQIALAHHRFVWIHPFSNGNGRVSRLFTYAMLRKTVFASHGHTALNPTSVFGNDRTQYIAALESADSMTSEGDIEWATFFAHGIRNDLARLVDMQDHDYVVHKLVAPALSRLRDDGIIDSQTSNILHRILHMGVVKAGDLADLLPGSPDQRSRAIRALMDRKLLRRAVEGPRFYHLSLSQGPIAGRLIHRLNDLGLLPRMLAND